MSATCPVHGFVLKKELINIVIDGQHCPVLTGRCPKCRNPYASWLPNTNAHTFKWGEQTYTYSRALDLEHSGKSKDKNIRLTPEERRQKKLDRKTQKEREVAKVSIPKKENTEKKKRGKKYLKPDPHEAYAVQAAIAAQSQISALSSSVVDFSSKENVLFVCKGITACKRQGHQILSATGIISNKLREPIKINANFCPQCGKYFISYDEYSYYRKLYGIVLGNFKISTSPSSKADFELSAESPLHLNSYTVSLSSNMSQTDRQAILRYIIDEGLLSKAEVISYLNGFINLNGKKASNASAVSRWKDDLDWVRNYQINEQQTFFISGIKHNR